MCMSLCSLLTRDSCVNRLQIFTVASERRGDDFRCKKNLRVVDRAKKIGIFRVPRYSLEKCGRHWAALAYSVDSVSYRSASTLEA